MALVAVKDQALLDQLDGGAPARGLKPVTDEKLLFELENGGGKRSMLDEAGRQVGLTARYGVEGLAALPNLVGDVLGLRSTEAVSNLLTKLGLPQPQGAQERVVGDITRGMAGAVTPIAAGAGIASGAGPGAVRNIGQVLAASPGGQILASGTGPGAAGVTRERGGGQVAQTVAGVLGAAAPGAVQATGESTVRGLLRGGEIGRARTAENIKTFEDAGTTPTVGQATENRGARLTETMLSKTPGSAGVMADKARTQAAEIGAKVEGLAEDLSPRATSTLAGAAIEKGVKGFVQRFRDEQGMLYDKLDTMISPDSRVSVANLSKILDESTKPISGAPALSAGKLGKPELSSLQKQLASDAADGTLPYEALKQLRTRVGEKLSGTSLTDDIDRGTWKRIYGALSDDMSAAATAAGPQAQKAFERANSYTRAGHERIDLYLNRVAGKDTVEKVFQAAVNPTEIREGASTVNAVLRSLDTDARDTVRAAFLKRLGTAGAGKQDATGEVFSPETFLTNWNKISPEAKMTLFADSKGTLREDMDQIAKAAANLREGSKIFANPSGTEAALSTRLGISGIVLSALLGHPGIAAGLAGGMGAANVGSKLLITNPEFVKWLAKTTTLSEGMLPGQLDSLTQIAAKQDPDVRKAMLDYRDEIRKKAPGASTLEARQSQGTIQR